MILWKMRKLPGDCSFIIKESKQEALFHSYWKTCINMEENITGNIHQRILLLLLFKYFLW